MVSQNGSRSKYVGHLVCRRVKTYRVPADKWKNPSSLMTVYSTPFLTAPNTPCSTLKYSSCKRYICLPYQLIRFVPWLSWSDLSYLQWGSTQSGANEWVVYVMRLSDVPKTVELWERLIDAALPRWWKDVWALFLVRCCGRGESHCCYAHTILEMIKNRWQRNVTSSEWKRIHLNRTVWRTFLAWREKREGRRRKTQQKLSAYTGCPGDIAPKLHGCLTCIAAKTVSPRKTAKSWDSQVKYVLIPLDCWKDPLEWSSLFYQSISVHLIWKIRLAHA